MSVKTVKKEVPSSLTENVVTEPFQFQPEWTVDAVIAEELDFDRTAIRRTTDMLEMEQTVPFIARYRKKQTNNMEVNQLRDVERLLQELKGVRTKAEYVAKSIHAKGKLTQRMLRDLQRATTLSEIELIFSAFKPASKKSLAERAKQVEGLQALAEKFIAGEPFNPAEFVDPGIKGRENVEALQTGIKHIIADHISNDQETALQLKEVSKDDLTRIEVTPVKAKDDKENQSRAKKQMHLSKCENYETYFNRRFFLLRDIQSFHVLAINRAEKQKLMNVKVSFPDRSLNKFRDYLFLRWVPHGVPPSVFQFWGTILKDAMERLLVPRLIRDVRSDLSKKAQEASLNVFGSNLKHLLMTPPISGKIIMGIDPGYHHGCKVAVISETSEILQTGVVYLSRRVETFDKLVGYLTAYQCRTIAIGNGTACRETEVLISNIIKHPVIAPLNVSYCIVNECGASIYSVSPLALEEMPDLDPNLRSAVSIARRLQNPMAELVKIDPKHLGVGQYQHDLPKGPLEKKLEGVVEDCVSFVGVDINSCSAELLRYVAGVGPAMAKKILKHRVLEGNFICRSQLMEVKGLGAKTYEQCVGFIRVNASHFTQSNKVVTSQVKDGSSLPSTSKVKSEDCKVKLEIKSEKFEVKSEKFKIKVEPEDDDIVYIKTEGQKRKAPAGKSSKSKKVKKTYEANPLDTTWIHPESYDAAERLVSMMGVTTADLGSPKIKQGIDEVVASIGSEVVAQNLGIDVYTLQIIIDGLKNPSNFDLRSDFTVPVFKKGVLSLNDVKVGAILTGQVSNVVDFGAFVDIGVGQDGLIHSSKMGGKTVVQGNKVEVTVMSYANRQGHSSKPRIGLRLQRVL